MGKCFVPPFSNLFDFSLEGINILGKIEFKLCKSTKQAKLRYQRQDTSQDKWVG